MEDKKEEEKAAEDEKDEKDEKDTAGAEADLAPDEGPPPAADVTTDVAVESAAAASPPADAKATEESSAGPSIVQRLKVPESLGRTGIAAIILGVLVILLALMLFLPGIMPVKVGAAKRAVTEQERADLQSVATRFSEAFINFSFRNLDSHLDKVAPFMTGDFKENYLSSMRSVRDALSESEAVSSGTVTNVATTRPESETAQAIVLIDRTVTNKDTPDGRETPIYLELTLVETSEGWKVAQAAQLEQVRL
jgi:hypothetical protein